MPYQSHSKNIFISYVCLCLYTRKCSSCPSNQPRDLGYSLSLINAHSLILLPVLPTGHITFHNFFNPIIMYYERCGVKQSPLFSQKVLQFRGRTDSILIDKWIELNLSKNEKCLKYWVALEKFHHSGFHGPVKFSICLIISIKIWCLC